MMIPMECRIITILVPDLARSNTPRYIWIRYNTFIMIRCAFGLTTFMITIDGGHDLSQDFTR